MFSDEERKTGQNDFDRKMSGQKNKGGERNTVERKMEEGGER